MPNLLKAMQKSTPSRNDLVVALTRAYEEGDLKWVEMVHQLAFGYKRELRKKITKQQSTNEKT